MTVEKCLDACLAQDFALAGVEYGMECCLTFSATDHTLYTEKYLLGCGNADLYGRHRLSPGSSFCNLPCTGNPAEICGGYNALNIYDRNKGLTVGPPQEFVGPYHNYVAGQCWKCVMFPARIRLLCLTYFTGMTNICIFN